MLMIAEYQMQVNTIWLNIPKCASSVHDDVMHRESRTN